MGKGDGLNCSGNEGLTKRRGQRREEEAKKLLDKRGKENIASDSQAQKQFHKPVYKSQGSFDDLDSGDLLDPIPVFDQEFFDQPFEEQVLDVEAALDSIGLGIESDGPPPPGEIGQRILDEGNKNPPFDLATGERIEAEDTEQANALWVTYDEQGEIDDVGYTEQRRNLHMKIIGKALVGEQERKEEVGWNSLQEWAESRGMTVEEARKQGVFHFGETVSLPLLDSEGNPVYKNGIGSLLGANHPITLKLLRRGVFTLTAQDKDEIRRAAFAARGGENPEALFLMGGTGAGKTSGLKQRPDLQPDHAIVLNPDDIKNEIPEFQEMLAAREPGAAALVHRESSRITSELKSLALETGLSLVLDGTGNWSVENFGQELDGIIEEGYTANLLAVDIPTDLALVRAVSRAVDTGRWVQEPVIRRTHRSVAENIGAYLDDPRFQETILFDNSGQEAVEVARASRGQLTVKNRGLLDRIFAKKDESTSRDIVEPRPGRRRKPSGIKPGYSPGEWIDYPLSDWTKYLGEKLPSHFTPQGKQIEDITGREIKRGEVLNEETKKLIKSFAQRA